ncbi:hypothetical protein [Synechococcus sp. RedBA-s]|uniref:hypothetical protein n=1 Tax=Synechococcus sp. RedBA-s TaxID=2823741 RepID=UPI0020CD006E|nr:hypothetical protein [Synechococcus sp. RedBA-s]MCP9800284.1 hypothetical protein [Synechococcus sp. RedBA-s]
MNEGQGATHPQRLLFLPGASGNIHFWKPVAKRLHYESEKVHLGWPGFDDKPEEPGVNGFEDLLVLVLAQLDRRCDLTTHPYLPDWLATDTTDLTCRLPAPTMISACISTTRWRH